MAKRYAALLRQKAPEGWMFRLRAGAMGSGPVLAAWPEATPIPEAIAAAEAFGQEHGLVVVVRRIPLERHLGRWLPGAPVETPDGAGRVQRYDSRRGRYLVLLDGEAEERRYAPQELRGVCED
jgi:hypothetical protein